MKTFAVSSAGEPLVAQSNMKEFDPRKERHWPLIIAKLVDPGCTAEIQIENCATGAITRITTTDDPHGDEVRIRTAVLAVFDNAWDVVSTAWQDSPPPNDEEVEP